MTKQKCGICDDSINTSTDDYLKIVLHPKGGSIWLLECITHKRCYDNRSWMKR